MSFQRYLKQTPTSTLNTGGYLPKLFQLDDIRASFPDAAKVGSVYVCPSTASLSSGIHALVTGPSTQLDQTEYTLIDLGKYLHIGLESDTNLFVLKKIKRTGTISSAGIATTTPETGYVIVSSKISFNVSGPEYYTEPYTFSAAF